MTLIQSEIPLTPRHIAMRFPFVALLPLGLTACSQDDEIFYPDEYQAYCETEYASVGFYDVDDAEIPQNIIDMTCSVLTQAEADNPGFTLGLVDIFFDTNLYNKTYDTKTQSGQIGNYNSEPGRITIDTMIQQWPGSLHYALRHELGHHIHKDPTMDDYMLFPDFVELSWTDCETQNAAAQADPEAHFITDYAGAQCGEDMAEEIAMQRVFPHDFLEADLGDVLNEKSDIMRTRVYGGDAFETYFNQSMELETTLTLPDAYQMQIYALYTNPQNELTLLDFDGFDFIAYAYDEDQQTWQENIRFETDGTALPEYCRLAYPYLWCQDANQSNTALSLDVETGSFYSYNLQAYPKALELYDFFPFDRYLVISYDSDDGDSEDYEAEDTSHIRLDADSGQVEKIDGSDLFEKPWTDLLDLASDTFHTDEGDYLYVWVESALMKYDPETERFTHVGENSYMGLFDSTMTFSNDGKLFYIVIDSDGVDSYVYRLQSYDPATDHFQVESESNVLFAESYSTSRSSTLHNGRLLALMYDYPDPYIAALSLPE